MQSGQPYQPILGQDNQGGQFQNQGYNPGYQPTNSRGPQYLSNSPLDRLEKVEIIYITQFFDWLQVLTGCQLQTKYHVMVADQQGRPIPGSRLFKIKEKSGCCSRQFCNGGCRAFDLNFSISPYDGFDNFDQEVCMRAERPWFCTFFCLERPEISLYSLMDPNKYIGKVVEPFYCCKMGSTIYDENNQVKYIIRESICQCGIICWKQPCKACQEAKFSVFDANDIFLTYVYKKSKGCLKAALTDASNWWMIFPQNCSSNDKILFISAIIYIHYCYFEEPQGNQN